MIDHSKAGPRIDLTILRFSVAYGPHQELCLYEITVRFKGRSTLEVHNN